MTNRIALVLGATGGIGGETATALERHGWRIRALTRNPAGAARKRPSGATWDWLQGDAMTRADVVEAAKGVGLIVHMANPAGYRNWDTTILPMFENCITAAKGAKARLVSAGSVYPFAFDVPVITETTPRSPTTRKGRIRMQVEERLESASKEGVRSLVVRAGDFFGPRPGSNWFSQVMVKPGRPVRSITYPVRKDIGHGWAYLPDLAETFAQLADREAELTPFAAFNFTGFWDPDGTAFIAAIKRVVGDPRIAVKPFPWALLRIMGLFNITMRELIEMRGLWENPQRLDNQRLVTFLGAEPRTPLDDAIRTTLEALECLPKQRAL